MDTPPLNRTPYSSGNVRSAARSYIAELRQARLARHTPDTPQSKGAIAPKPAAKTKPKIGKRGVRAETLNTAPDTAPQADDLRADALSDLHAISGKPAPAASPKRTSTARKTKKTEGSPPAKNAVAQHNARESVRKGAAQARAAAHEAQQKIRDARLKQRAAAAQQRENLKAARAKQAQNRAKNAQTTDKAPEIQRRRWAPARRSVHASAPSISSAAPKARAKAEPMALTSIRGIGEAMNRRLQQAGIADLSDLLALPAETIRERLGPVSALANVEGWQAQAATYLSSDT